MSNYEYFTSSLGNETQFWNDPDGMLRYASDAGFGEDPETDAEIARRETEAFQWIALDRQAEAEQLRRERSCPKPPRVVGGSRRRRNARRRVNR